MNYSENYLNGATMLDGEMEQFDHNPADFVSMIGWSKDMQVKAETVRGKLELVKDDYLKLEKILDDHNGDVHCDAAQDYITNLFSAKILKALKPGIYNKLEY